MTQISQEKFPGMKAVMHTAAHKMTRTVIKAAMHAVMPGRKTSVKVAFL